MMEATGGHLAAGGGSPSRLRINQLPHSKGGQPGVLVVAELA
jgi:hypothetical protein